MNEKYVYQIMIFLNKTSTQAVGYQIKVSELAQFFTGGNTSSAKNTNTDNSVEG